MTDQVTAEVVDVCALDELTPGVVRVVDFPDRPALGVLLVEGELHAFGLMCPHRGGPLQKGTVRPGLSSDAPGDMRHRGGPVLTCPWHNWEFCLDSGLALFDKQRKLRMYVPELVDDRVRVRLSD